MKKIGIVLKFGELKDDDNELDAQAVSRSIGGVALYGKATEPQEFGELNFGEMKKNHIVYVTISHGLYFSIVGRFVPAE